jgi:hypothetical protein
MKPQIQVYCVPNHPYPWRFNITYQGATHIFAGMPNMCSTKRQALKRAWWRAKWLIEGTFEQKYL